MSISGRWLLNDAGRYEFASKSLYAGVLCASSSPSGQPMIKTSNFMASCSQNSNWIFLSRPSCCLFLRTLVPARNDSPARTDSHYCQPDRGLWRLMRSGNNAPKQVQPPRTRPACEDHDRADAPTRVGCSTVQTDRACSNLDCALLDLLSCTADTIAEVRSIISWVSSVWDLIRSSLWIDDVMSELAALFPHSHLQQLWLCENLPQVGTQVGPQSTRPRRGPSQLTHPN